MESICKAPSKPGALDAFRKARSLLKDAKSTGLFETTLIHGYRWAGHSTLYWVIWARASESTETLLDELLEVRLDDEVRKDAYYACIALSKLLEFQLVRLAPGAESETSRNALFAAKKGRVTCDYVVNLLSREPKDRIFENESTKIKKKAKFDVQWVIPKFAERMRYAPEDMSIGTEFIAQGKQELRIFYF